MNDTSQGFVGRQPIMNTRETVIGHDLMIQGVSDVRYDALRAEAKESVLLLEHLFEHVDLEELLGSTTGFLTVNEDLLHSEVLGILPKDRVVLQIPYLDAMSDALLKRCQKVVQEGRRICLNDYRRRDPREKLLEAATHVKLDALATSEADLRRLARRLGKMNVSIVASRVETPAQYHNLIDYGVQLFQGYYFAEPILRDSEALDAERAVLIDLLMEVQRECDLERIANAFKRNAMLGVNLLRLVNGLQLARSQKVASVEQALMMIGAQGLSRWLNLMLFAGGDDEGTSTPLLRLATTRGKMLELLTQGDPTLAPDVAKERAEQAFLVGMLSLVHAQLGMTRERAIATMNLVDEIREPLEHRRGRIGRMLELCERSEAGDAAGVEEILADLDLSMDVANAARLAAYRWADGL